jgi:hypothetical protein
MVVRALERRIEITVPAGIVGRVWRDGRRQVLLVRLLGSDVVSVVDTAVVLCARARGTAIVTSDPRDLRRLDRAASLIVV